MYLVLPWPGILQLSLALDHEEDDMKRRKSIQRQNVPTKVLPTKLQTAGQTSLIHGFGILLAVILDDDDMVEADIWQCRSL